MNVKLIAMVLAGVVTIGMAAQAAAQSYPIRPVRMIVPSTAGSPLEVLARLVAQSVSGPLGQPMTVEPRPGGGGTVATNAVATADPDGYTLLFTEGGRHLMTPVLYKNITFDPVRDFVPVATVGGGSFVMVVPPSLPVQSVKDLVTYANANPGKVNFGFGQGTLPHILGESLKAATGAQINSIPYKGGARAVADMLGGHIQLNFGTTATLLPLIRSGKLRALAVTSEARNPDLPDVPTMKESGFPELALGFWMAVWAPARTPPAAVDRLNREIVASLASPDLRASMTKAGFEPMPKTTKEVAAFVTSEAPQWLVVAKSSGVTGD